MKKIKIIRILKNTKHNKQCLVKAKFEECLRHFEKLGADLKITDAEHKFATGLLVIKKENFRINITDDSKDEPIISITGPNTIDLDEIKIFKRTKMN